MWSLVNTHWHLTCLKIKINQSVHSLFDSHIKPSNQFDSLTKDPVYWNEWWCQYYNNKFQILLFLGTLTSPRLITTFKTERNHNQPKATIFEDTIDLPTSRASKAELGARKVHTMRAKTEREARGLKTATVSPPLDRIELSCWKI